MDNTENLEIMPKTVRAILNIDNDKIISLCKVGDIPLKSNKKGLTYFTSDDVKTLQSLNDIQNKTKSIEEKQIKLKNDFKKNISSKPENKIAAPAVKNTERTPQHSYSDTVKLLKQITGTVKNIEKGIYNKFSNILEVKLEEKLEEKLGGLDEVIIDLVRSKTENETLRKQLCEKEKEIYSLKNELSGYKKLAGNIYIKSRKKNNEII